MKKEIIKQKKIIEEIIQTFLEMEIMTEEAILNAREKTRELGLEKIFDEELDKIKKRMPNISFKERSLIGLNALSKQPSFSLEEMRAQVLWTHARTPTGVNDLVIKSHLKMYYPDWTPDQIEKGCDEIKNVISKETKIYWKNIYKSISGYFLKASKKKK